MGVNTTPRRDLASRHPKAVVCAGNFAVSEGAIAAILDMNLVNAQLDCVLVWNTPGVSAGRLKVIGDSPAAGGVTITRSGTDFTAHFEPGVSTQLHLTNAITALAGGDDLFDVQDAGTGGTLLQDGRAYIAMNTAFGDVDSVVKAGFNTGAAGNGYVVMGVPDGEGAGELTVLPVGPGRFCIFHFESALTDVENFEDAVDALADVDFAIKTAGTPATTFDDPADAAQDVLENGTDVHAENDFEAFIGGAAPAAVSDLVGGIEVESVTHVSTGLYRVKLRDDFPEMLAVDAMWHSAAASEYEVQGVAFDPKARTFDLLVVDGAGAAADPASGSVHFCIAVTNHKDGRIAALT
jgi:hypothetical protein